MHAIVIANQKGGVGKTSAIVNLAAALAEKKKRVLVIDLDAQGNATSWLGAGDIEGKGVFAALCERAPLADIIVDTTVKGVALAPSTAWLAGAEKALAKEVGAETILRRAIKAVQGDYDIVLIDTPPTLGTITIGAMTAANHVIIPVEANSLSLAGLAQIAETIDLVRDRLNDGLSILGVLLSRVDPRTRHAADVEAALRQRFPKETFKAFIRASVRMAEAPGFSQSILEYDPAGGAADDFRAVANEITQRLSRKGR